MSAVAVASRTGERPAVPRAPRRMPAAAAGLTGLAAIAVLLPLRGNWLVGLLLVGLIFTVPGVLALRALRVPSAAVRAYPIYIPAAALLVMIAAGLAADLLGPVLGAPKPLHGALTAIATLGVSLVLWLAGIRAPDATRFPWRLPLVRPSLLAPLILPALSAAGALLLSNGRGPLLVRVAAVLSVATLLLCLLAAGRLSRGQVGMVLFACALSTEWAFSLRSQEIVGFDITTELHIAQHTQAVGVWQTSHRGDAYGAMLSITVLPSTLAALTGCSPLIIFKLVYPALVALLPVSVFLVGERIMSRPFAAGAAALLIVQSYFFQQLPELARQELGLLFFAALVSALSDPYLRTRSRLPVVAALAAGLVVSHYSSTYLAIPAFVLALIIGAVISKLRRVPLVSAELLCGAAVLAGGAGIWYVAVTHSTSNVELLVSSLEQRGVDPLPNHQGNVVASYLNGNVVERVSGPRFERLAVRDYQRTASYIRPLASAHQSRYRLQSASVPTPAVRHPALARAVNLLTVVVAELMLIFGVIGAVVMIASRRTQHLTRRIGILAFGTVGILALIRFSGTVAANYNQTRALLQSLILLALPAAWLAERLVQRLGSFRRIAIVTGAVMALALTGVFAGSLGVTALAVGGGTSLNLSQGGEDFERHYMTPGELAGADWAAGESREKLLYADRYGQLRLYATSGTAALTDVTPETIDRQAWVYGTRTNVVLGRARGQIANFASIYRWPAAFMNRNFNAVYTNGDSTVYHR